MSDNTLGFSDSPSMMGEEQAMDQAVKDFDSTYGIPNQNGFETHTDNYLDGLANMAKSADSQALSNTSSQMQSTAKNAQQLQQEQEIKTINSTIDIFNSGDNVKGYNQLAALAQKSPAMTKNYPTVDYYLGFTAQNIGDP